MGSVLSFFPIIVVLFFFLSILEDLGYMARVAFVMDKLLRKIGLSGLCAYAHWSSAARLPAIMATENTALGSGSKMTILLTPFMSCSPSCPSMPCLPRLFPKHGALVMVGLYFTGIIVGILYALLLKDCLSGGPVPFVMELPNYRMPGLKNVAQLICGKGQGFL